MNVIASSLLIVDDDPDLRDLLSDLLMVDGHEVRTAPDGIEALHALDVRFPQLVITDLEMPTLDGQAMIYRMFVENLGRENVPVILMSASPRLREARKPPERPMRSPSPSASTHCRRSWSAR